MSGKESSNSPLAAVGFRVAARKVGRNPTDPDGLRRSQRAVVDLLKRGLPAVAFHAPTGAGKTHILRHLTKSNAALPKSRQRRLIFAFPIRSLVLQQAAETGAQTHDMASAFERFTRTGMAAEDGTPEAIAYRAFLKSFRVPAGYRPSAIMREVLDAPLASPLALTPDSLWLALRGIVADSDLDTASEDLADLDPKAIVEALQGRKGPLQEAARYTFPLEQARAFAGALHGALVALDEYHLLAGFPAFARLVATLRALGAQILFMSGTPRPDFLRDHAPDCSTVDFEALEAESLIPWDEPKDIFNHPMEVTIEERAYTRPQLYDPYEDTLPILKAWEEAGAPGPNLIVFECFARCRRAILAYEKDPHFAPRLLWWTGPLKHPDLEAMLRGEKPLPNDALVVATSAIELGVDLPFRNIITESEYHATLMQRLARIGRFGTRAKGRLHHAHILTRRAIHGGPPQGLVPRAHLSAELARILSLPLMPPDEDREGLYLRSSNANPMLAIYEDAKGWHNVRSHPGLLLAFPPGPRFSPDWSHLPAADRRKILVEDWGLPAEAAHRILWEEMFTPTSFAYIHTGEAPLEGALELRDHTIPHTPYVLRRYVLVKRSLAHRGKSRNPARERVLAEYRIRRRHSSKEPAPGAATSSGSRERVPLKRLA